MIVGSLASSLERFRGALIDALLAEDCSVSVAVPDIDEQIKARMHQRNVETYCVHINRQGLNVLDEIRTVFSLYKSFRKSKPDLVLTYTIKPNIWGGFAAWLAGSRSVSMITGLGYAFTETGGSLQRFVGFLSRRLYSVSLGLNRAVIFQNPDDMHELVSTHVLGEKTKALVVNGSGIDLGEFEFREAPRSGRRFLMLARILKSKGVVEYCRAAAVVKAEHPDVEFVLAGEFDGGPDAINESELERLMGTSVTFLGVLKDVRSELEKSNVVVLPSYREGTPRSILEALAVGRPVITTDVPGCRETVKIGVNGLLVDAKSISGLSAAIGQLCRADNERLWQMGRESRDLAVEKFDIDNVNGNIIAFLRKQVADISCD